MNPLSHKLKLIEIFFNKYGVPALFVAVQGVLSLYGSGKTTGVVLDSGDGVTHVVPVYEGYSLPHACERIDLGGRDVTLHLMQLLKKNGANFHTSVTTVNYVRLSSSWSGSSRKPSAPSVHTQPRKTSREKLRKLRTSIRCQMVQSWNCLVREPLQVKFCLLHSVLDLSIHVNPIVT